MAVNSLARARREARPARVARSAATLEPISARRAVARASSDRGQIIPLPAGHHPTNLPVPLTSFVGRERELAEITQLLAITRLVTLTGAGGVGKTRLALQAASVLQGGYRDGIAWIELASLADPALVPHVVAGVLGLRAQPDRPLTDTLVGHLRPRRLLLVLDNCEHLLDACARLVDTLLAACPTLQVLTTSRQRLGLSGELAWRVPSLALPDPGCRPVLACLAEAEAVRLFVERARLVRPDFALTERTAPAIAQICQQLDGLPLAIELAAARMSVLSVEQLAERLDDRFRLLTGGSRTALPRQQTLRATVEWSYEALDEPERRLFRQLVVFASGFTLDSAVAVCADAAPDSVLSTQYSVLDSLTALVDKSLVVAEPGPDSDMRYWLLETLRQYGWEKLVEAGEAVTMQGRHLDWCLALAERAAPELEAAEQSLWLARLDAADPDLRAVLGWCLEDDVQAGLRLAGSLWPFWQVRSRFREGRHWLERLLHADGAPSPAPTVWRVKALLGAGTLAAEEGALGAARTWYEEGLVLSRTLGETDLTARLLRELGRLLTHMNEREPARVCLDESLALARAAGDQHGLAVSLYLLANWAAGPWDHQRAIAWCEESLAVLRALGDRWLMSHVLHLLGRIALVRGDIARAETAFTEVLATAQELGSPQVIAACQWLLGRVAQWRGDLARAMELYEAGLTLAQAHNDRSTVAWVLASLGRIVHLQGDPEQAIALLEESLALHTAMDNNGGISTALHGLGLATAARGDRARATAHLRQALAIRQRIMAHMGIAECLEALAMVAVGDNVPFLASRATLEEAVGLLGAADALRATIGAPLPAVEQPGLEATMRAARARLGEAAFAAAWAAGRAQPPTAGLAITRAAEEITVPAVPTPTPAADPLADFTRREREVFSLVVRGLSNRQIATELSIGERTVETHVTNILGKLHLASRREIVAWAVDHDLVTAACA